MASKCPRACRDTSIHRQCGSSQQALHFEAQAVMSAHKEVVIARGVEAMSGCEGRASSRPAKETDLGRQSTNIEQLIPHIQSTVSPCAEMMAAKYASQRRTRPSSADGSHQQAIAATDKEAGSRTRSSVPITRAAVRPNPTPSTRTSFRRSLDG